MVVILGGGISGLSAAYYAMNKLTGASIHLVEASNRLGGWIQTTRTRDGLLLEHGPRTIRPVRPIPRDHPAAKNRMIYANGSLHTLPSTLRALFTTNSPLTRPLASVVISDMKASKKKCSDESSYDFIARRLGHDVADYLISPLLCGICAGDAHNISVKMLFRSLFEVEQKYGSIFIGMLRKALSGKNITNSIALSNLAERAKSENWSVYSLSNGLQTLPEALENALRTSTTNIYMNDGCAKLNIGKECVEIQLNSGKKLITQRVISSVSAQNLASLVQEQHPELANYLSQIPIATVAVVNLRYKGNILKNPAFGFLVPPKEKIPLLGVVYDSVCFPNSQNDTVLTVMMGGHWYHPQFTKATEKQLAQIAKDCVGKILNIQAAPTLEKVSVQRDCIPQYTVGHYERLGKIWHYINENKLPLHLIGCSYNGIGLNDVIMSAKEAVDSISLTS
ncbi:hypothetical protein B566_EDAN000817 [Ephemera danica]|nr:hypothetical protein B566_EDAN000817 [Ephemera danica]